MSITANLSGVNKPGPTKTATKEIEARDEHRPRFNKEQLRQLQGFADGFFKARKWVPFEKFEGDLVNENHFYELSPGRWAMVNFRTNTDPDDYYFETVQAFASPVVIFDDAVMRVADNGIRAHLL